MEPHPLQNPTIVFEPPMKTNLNGGHPLEKFLDPPLIRLPHLAYTSCSKISTLIPLILIRGNPGGHYCFCKSVCLSQNRAHVSSEMADRRDLKLYTILHYH